MGIRKLTCPSCGAQVDIPVDLGTAHCVYCGSKLLVGRADEVEREAIETHLQLGRTALEANNSQEALEHFNKVLEADPKNVEAWIGKAKASQGLSTVTHDRLDEALRYIDKALELDPESAAARRAKGEIKWAHSRWWNYLGNEEWKLAVKMADTYLQPVDLTEAIVGVHPSRESLAHTEIAPHVRKALDYYRGAFALDPDNHTVLENIAWVLSHDPGGREYGDPTPSLKAAKFLEERENIRQELAALREELFELEQLKQQRGFGLLDHRRGRYSRIKKRIAELESLVEAAAALGIDTKI